MELENALHLALEGKAIMFAGSGYSSGAINLYDQQFKQGDELAKYFSNECKLPSNTALDDAAEFYLEKFSIDKLIKEIQNLYTVKTITSFHEKISKIPWKRIYTTNYDNVLEVSYSKNSKKLIPITLSADIYKIPKEQNLCIHLNGFIDRLDRGTINSELKLTESSYLTASLIDSKWILMFRNDIQLASAVFFLGYSLYDLDIKRILFTSSELKEKCFFIIGKNPNEITVKRVERFGTPIKKSIEEFTKDIEKANLSFQPSYQNEPIFLSIKEYKAEYGPTSIADRDFINLLMYGDLKKNQLLESINTGEKYFLKRECTDEIFSLFKKGHHICLISSDLGNGKSLLIENVNFLAVKNNFRVFNIKERNEESIREFDNLLFLKGKVLITIDGYQDWLDQIKNFSLNSAQDKYLLLTARTALHDVLYDDLVNITGKDFLPEIQIDILTEKEISWFVDAFDEYGLWGERASDSSGQKFNYLKNNCQGQIHSILLKFLDSPNISQRLKKIYLGIKDLQSLYEVALSIFILATINQSTSFDTVVDLWGTEKISSIRTNKQSPIKELINFDNNNVTVKSSIVGEYFLRNIADASLIVKVLLQIANRVHIISKDNEKYRTIFRSLMKFSNVQQILPEEGRKAGVMKYYESIKTFEWCKHNPLFWLQYAIACIVIKDLYRAKRYFDNAYSFATKMSWDTFQIDNHYARYLLLFATDEINDPTEAMVNFRQARNIINRQMVNERLHYPFKVASLYQPFFDKFNTTLPVSDVDFIKKAAEEVLKKINTLSEASRRWRNIQDCELAMECILDFKIK